jgi:hypothetical protein
VRAAHTKKVFIIWNLNLTGHLVFWYAKYGNCRKSRSKDRNAIVVGRRRDEAGEQLRVLGLSAAILAFTGGFWLGPGSQTTCQHSSVALNYSYSSFFQDYFVTSWRNVVSSVHNFFFPFPSFCSQPLSLGQYSFKPSSMPLLNTGHVLGAGDQWLTE